MSEVRTLKDVFEIFRTVTGVEFFGNMVNLGKPGVRPTQEYVDDIVAVQAAHLGELHRVVYEDTPDGEPSPFLNTPLCSPAQRLLAALLLERPWLQQGSFA